jgi:hypothetical protein
MKMYGGVEVQFHTFLTSALDEGEWSASCPGHFTLEKSPMYQLDRRMCRPQSQCECSGREKIPKTSRELNPSYPAHILVIILTEVSWLLN